MELVAVGRIICIPTENTPWRDHLQRPLAKVMRIHGTRLNWRSMGPKQDFFCDVEGVLHITSWVILWQVHAFKVVVVFFDFKAIYDLVAHPDKDIFDFFTGLGQDMAMTNCDWTSRKGHIDTLTS